MTILRILHVLLALACGGAAHSQNYIRYHQRSLQAQELIASNSNDRALVVLGRLEKKYGLMPTETFALALCQAATGDTTAARRSYLKCIEQRGHWYWLEVTPPPLRSAQDTGWYNSVLAESLALCQTIPRYVDGPNPGIPTVVSHLNIRHQYVLDSMAMLGADQQKSAQRIYDTLIIQHDLLLDSIINGRVPFPSIATYGINEEFETFLLHCSPQMKHRNEHLLKRWLEQGLIYPVTYAFCLDDQAFHKGEPFPYGCFSDLKPEQILPGYEKRRASIGMGDQQLENLRFHRGSWQSE